MSEALSRLFRSTTSIDIDIDIDTFIWFNSIYKQEKIYQKIIIEISIMAKFMVTRARVKKLI